jgi:hypothetical protein
MVKRFATDLGDGFAINRRRDIHRTGRVIRIAGDGDCGLIIPVAEISGDAYRSKG